MPAAAATPCRPVRAELILGPLTDPGQGNLTHEKMQGSLNRRGKPVVLCAGQRYIITPATPRPATRRRPPTPA